MIIGGARSWGVVSLSPEKGNEGGMTVRDARRPRARCVPMALDYVGRSASNRVSRFVWNLIPLREGSWNQDIWCGRNRTDGRASPLPPHLSGRVVLVDVDSRSPSLSIERTSLFPPFNYIGSAMPLARSIVRHARCDYRDGSSGTWQFGVLTR